MSRTLPFTLLLIVRNGKPDKRRTLVRNSARVENLIRQITKETGSLYQKIEQNFSAEDMEKLFQFLELLAESPHSLTHEGLLFDFTNASRFCFSISSSASSQ
jgi:hemerythrin-like domain-containing protein